MLQKHHSPSNCHPCPRKLLLQPRFILFQKQTKYELLFKKLPISGALGKKYYGRKIIFLTKQTDLVHALNNRKLITGLNFYEGCLLASRLKSKGDKILCDADIPIKNSHLKKILPSFQEAIDFREIVCFSAQQIFKMMRLYMRQTKQISFIWTYNNNIYFDTGFFSSLRCLEKLVITVEVDFGIRGDHRYRISDADQASNLSRFMQNITNLPRLETFWLCLKDHQMDINLALNLLLLVVNSNLTNWHISVMIPVEDVKNVHILRPVLAQISTLGVFTAPVGFNLSEIRIPKHHGNHRILSLFFQESTKFNQQVNLHSILKHCASLHTLSIGLEAPLFIYKEENLTFFSKWARHLHTASLSVSLNSQSLPLNSLLQRIQKESEALKSIGVLISGASSFNFPAIYEITATKSLESVQVSLQTTHFQQLSKLAAFSPNLSILHLQISHLSGQNYWDDELPFSQLRNLKELVIKFGCPSGEGLWGDSLAHQILTLQNLEVLSIQTQNQWSMLLLKLWILMNNAALLPNLRFLNLDTTITPVLTKKNRVFTDLDRKYMMSGFTAKDVLNEIQQKINYMIEVHRRIEHICIQKLLALETSIVFYTRYDRYDLTVDRF